MEQVKKYELLKDDTIKVIKSNYIVSKDNPNGLVKICDIGDVDDIDEKQVLSYKIDLYRIRALIDFGDVKKGNLGGYIQREENLSHEGNAWIYDEAKVYGSAKVYGNAQIRCESEVSYCAEVFGNAVLDDESFVSEYARVYGDSKLFGSACVEWEAEVYGNAEISNEALIAGCARVYGNACVSDESVVWGRAEVYGKAEVFENAEVSGHAKVYGNAMVYGNAKVKDNAEVYGVSKVFGNAFVCDHVKVYDFGAICDRAEVTKDAKVTKSLDCIFFRSDWEKARWNKEILVIDNLVGDCLTYTHSNQKWHIGRFYGSGEELIAEAYKKDQQTGDWFKAHVEFVKTLHNIKEQYTDDEAVEK